jgi:hypothetical protein
MCETRFLGTPYLTAGGNSKLLCNTLETYLCIMNHTLDAVNHERDAETAVHILEGFRKISQIFTEPCYAEIKKEDDENPLQGDHELLKTWLVPKQTEILDRLLTILQD